MFFLLFLGEIGKLPGEKVVEYYCRLENAGGI